MAVLLFVLAFVLFIAMRGEWPTYAGFATGAAPGVAK